VHLLVGIAYRINDPGEAGRIGRPNGAAIIHNSEPRSMADSLWPNPIAPALERLQRSPQNERKPLSVSENANVNPLELDISMSRD